MAGAQEDINLPDGQRRENAPMPQPPLRVGLIGLGAVGQGMLRLLAERAHGEFEVVAALVRDQDRIRDCESCSLVKTVDELLAARPDVVLEAGGHHALATNGPAVLRGGCDLLMISIGALADPGVERDILRSAELGLSRAFVVSGAIGGLDALASAAIGGLDTVTVTTRKPAATFLSQLDGPATVGGVVEIFRGSAREAALKFPESVNVAAAVSLAGIGFDRTHVRVIADPGIDRNLHEVVAEGAFGRLRVEISNVPTEMNPRSAKLVAMSAVHALVRRRSILVVG